MCKHTELLQGNNYGCHCSRSYCRYSPNKKKWPDLVPWLVHFLLKGINQLQLLILTERIQDGYAVQEQLHFGCLSLCCIAQEVPEYASKQQLLLKLTEQLMVCAAGRCVATSRPCAACWFLFLQLSYGDNSSAMPLLLASWPTVATGHALVNGCPNLSTFPLMQAYIRHGVLALRCCTGIHHIAARSCTAP